MSFRMVVTGVFRVAASGRTVVTGRVEHGSLRVGDRVEMVRAGVSVPTTVKGLEVAAKITCEILRGEDAGVLIDDVEGFSIREGDVLSRP